MYFVLRAESNLLSSLTDACFSMILPTGGQTIRVLVAVHPLPDQDAADQMLSNMLNGLLLLSTSLPANLLSIRVSSHDAVLATGIASVELKAPVPPCCGIVKSSE